MLRAAYRTDERAEGRSRLNSPISESQMAADGSMLQLTSEQGKFQGPICLYGSEAGSVEACYNRYRGPDGVEGWNYPAVASTISGTADPGYDIYYGFSKHGVSLGGHYSFCPDKLSVNYSQNHHAVDWYSSYRPNMINGGETYSYDATHMAAVRDGTYSGITFSGYYSWIER